MRESEEAFERLRQLLLVVDKGLVPALQQAAAALDAEETGGGEQARRALASALGEIENARRFLEG